MARVVIGVFFAIVLLFSWQGWGVERLEGRIVDDETGQPLAPALLLSDAEGKGLEIEGRHAHVQYIGKRRCYVDGAFVLNARPGHLKVEVRRGPETLPFQTDIDFTLQTART